MVGMSGPVTVETCTAACKASNFAIAGLEYGGECCTYNQPTTVTRVQIKTANLQGVAMQCSAA